MRLDQLIKKQVEKNSNKIAITFKNQNWTYFQFYNAIKSTSSFLQNECKLVLGDRICFYGTNNPEQIIVLFAASKLGIILVPINWRLAIPEILFQVNQSSPKLMIFDLKFSENVNVIRNKFKKLTLIPIKGGSKFGPSLSRRRIGFKKSKSFGNLNSPILLVYTSGTTGEPKGALLSQKSILCNADMSHHAHSMDYKDTVLVFLPLFHVGGLNILLMPALLMGAKVFLGDKFDPCETLKIIEKHKITQIITVPTILSSMVSHEKWNSIDIQSLKMISIGSTDVPIELIQKVHKRNIPVIQIYGATETSPLAIYQTKENAYSTEGSIGKEGLYCEIRIVNDKNIDVSNNEKGEILVKGDNVLKCYWKDNASTKGHITKGWFHTGDIARRDEEGNYWFIDRIKNVIISGGENIYPAELEKVLRKTGEISEFSIVGKKDKKWGQVPVIVAVKKNVKVSEQEILDEFKDKIANYKIPKKVIFVKELPRNALGKIIVDKVKKIADR